MILQSKWYFCFLLLWLLSCQEEGKTDPQTAFFAANDTAIEINGRFTEGDENMVAFGWSATEIRTQFSGPTCRLMIESITPTFSTFSYSPSTYFRVEVDGKVQVLQLEEGETSLLLGEDFGPGWHDLSVFKRTEAETGYNYFYGVKLATGETLRSPKALPERKIEFYGNSITCGFGNEGDNRDCPFEPLTENAWETYASITARSLAANYRTICFSGKGIYQNYGQNKEAPMPELYDRVYPQLENPRWDFSTWQADLVVINLGTNDFSHENPSPEDFVGEYVKLVQKLAQHYPEAQFILLTGSMMNDGGNRNPLSSIKGHLDQVVNELGMDRVHRFDLSTQGDLGYGCAWHPNLAQHKKNAGELTGFIRDRFGW